MDIHECMGYQIGGGIYLSVLTAKNGTMLHIQTELRARGVKPRKLEKKSIKELKELLKEDKLKRKVVEMQQEGLEARSIKYIKPLSNEMKRIFSLEDQVEQKRLSILDNNDNIDKLWAVCDPFIVQKEQSM